VLRQHLLTLVTSEPDGERLPTLWTLYLKGAPTLGNEAYERTSRSGAALTVDPVYEGETQGLG